MKIFIQAFVFVAIILFSTAWAAKEASTPVYTQKTPYIHVSASDPQFTVTLISNPTTGYSWFLKNPHPDLELIRHHFQTASQTTLIGAPGSELWVFKVRAKAFATAPLKIPLQLIYVRPWEKARPAETVVFWITTP